jgi:hypothetical protein
MRPKLYFDKGFKLSGLSITVFLLAIFTSVLFSSCRREIVSGSGNIVSEQRDVPAFTAISVSAPVQALVRVSPSFNTSIQLKGYKNLLQKIRTEVINGKLSIYVEDDIVMNTDENIIAEITCPGLNKLVSNGASDIEVDGEVRSGNFTIAIGGAGDIVVDSLTTSQLIADISGAGRLVIHAGNAQKADLKVSGAGNIKAYGLVCADAHANVSGAGFIRMNATQKLDAKITGAGNISYKGNPAITSSISAAGGLNNAN